MNSDKAYDHLSVRDAMSRAYVRLRLTGDYSQLERDLAALTEWVRTIAARDLCKRGVTCP